MTIEHHDFYDVRGYVIKVYIIDNNKYIPEVEDILGNVLYSTSEFHNKFNNQNYWDSIELAHLAAKELINHMKEKKIGFTVNSKVCTRDGKKVRILCVDANNPRPIVALVTNTDNSGKVFEWVNTYLPNGRVYPDVECDQDLISSPWKTVKYVNIFKSNAYDTLEEAKENGKMFADYIKTIITED